MKRTLFLGHLFGKEKSKETQKEYAGVEQDQKIRKSNDLYAHGGSGREQNQQAIFLPRHGMFKGYMRDSRTWGRKRKAA